MHKENMQNGMIKDNLKDKFYTTDLATAAYLRTKGINVEVKKVKKKGKFFYPKENQSDVDDFFKNKGDFLTYAMNIRSIKSEIQNKRGGD